MTATTQSRTNSLQLVYWLMAVYFIDAAYAFSPLVAVPSLGEFLCLTILWEIHLSLGDMLKFFVSARKKESLFRFLSTRPSTHISLPIYVHIHTLTMQENQIPSTLHLCCFLRCKNERQKHQRRQRQRRESASKRKRRLFDPPGREDL